MRTPEELLGLDAEPSELRVRREEVLTKLRQQVGAASGAVADVFRCVIEAVSNTKPGSEFRPELVKNLGVAIEAFSKESQCSKQPLKLPSVLQEATTFIGDHLASARQRMAKAGVEIPEDIKNKAAKLVEEAAHTVKSIQDTMESAPGRRATGELLGSVDAPLSGSTAPQKEVPEDLKNWKNPALGRIGNK